MQYGRGGGRFRQVYPTVEVYGRGAVRAMPAEVLVREKAFGFPVIAPVAAPEPD